MMKINDAQDQAIWDAIGKEHTILCKMYKERRLLEKRQEQELDDYVSKIGEQEIKVQELCEGKTKIHVDSENRLILDLTK